MVSKDKKSVGDMFGGHADLYAQARPTYPIALFDYIQSLAPNKGTVWDCAAGTGQATAALAQRFRNVDATDINADQVLKAEEALSGLSNVNFSVQSAESSNFEAGRFDVITVAQALHWFDYSSFWGEVKRVLKPGGLFAAWGYNWTRTDFYANEMLEEELFRVLTPFWSEKAKILWDGYQTEVISFPFERIIAPEFNIKMNWNLAQVLNYFRSWSSTQTAIKTWGNDDFFALAMQSVAESWGKPELKRTIEFPLHLCFGYKD